MNQDESLRRNFPRYADYCTVDDLLWVIRAAAEVVQARGLAYARELVVAEEHVRQLWEADRGARAVERFRGRTSEVGEAY